jgi:hypothetical protein
MKQVASMLTVGFQCRFKTLEVTNNGHQSILYVDEERANPRYHVILIVTRNEKTKTQSSNQSHIYVVNQISYVDMLMLMLPSTTPSFHLRPESGAVPLQAAHTVPSHCARQDSTTYRSHAAPNHGGQRQTHRSRTSRRGLRLQ